MANDRLDAMVCRESNGKKFWTKIGAAFPNKQGGWNVTLDATPLDGKICLFPPREKQDRGAAPVQQETRSLDNYGKPTDDDGDMTDINYGKPTGGNDDGDIPF